MHLNPKSNKQKKKMFEHDFEIYHDIDSSHHTIPTEYHDFYELFFFVSGNVDFLVNDEIYQLQRGDLLFVPPGVLHNPIFKNFDIPYDRFILWISKACMDSLIKQDPDVAYFTKPDSPKIYLLRNHGSNWTSVNATFTALYNSYNEKKLCYHTEGISMISQIMIDYNRALFSKSKSIIPGTGNTLLTKVLRYIHTNLQGDLSLDTIASVFYTDKFYISHLFKENIKISYYQYVIQKRLILSLELLKNGVPIHKIHESCGFSDYTCFYRAFKKEYNTTPSKYKKLNSTP